MKKMVLRADDPIGQRNVLEIKRSIIRDYIRTAAGRKKLADSMTQPLRDGGRDDVVVTGCGTLKVE